MKSIFFWGLALVSQIAYSQVGFVDYYLAPSRRMLDWSTPASIAKSFIGSRVRAHELNPSKTRVKTAMGHGMVHYKCSLPDGTQVESWSGITGQADSELSQQLVFKDQIGISVLFRPFEDGYIQNEETVRATLASYSGRLEADAAGDRRRLQPVFLRTKIDPETCRTLHGFYLAHKKKSYAHAPTREELTSKKVQDRLLFGLPIEPVELYKKNGPDGVLGGGCTSYAAAFLQLAGLYDSTWDRFFKQELRIAPELMGGAENPVPFRKILFGKLGKSWTHGSGVTEGLSFYDPEMIWDFFDTISACTGDARAHNVCSPEVKHWLQQKNYRVKLIEEEVNGTYKNANFLNRIRGIELN